MVAYTSLRWHMLCYSGTRFAVCACCATLAYAWVSYAILGYAVLPQPMLCYFSLFYATLRTLRYRTLPYAVPVLLALRR